MELIKICLVALLLTGCGRGSFDVREVKKLPRTKHEISAELETFVQSFESEFRSRDMDIVLKDKLYDYKNLDWLDRSIVGVCWKSRNGQTRRIEIQREYFDGLDYAGKEQLLYHELAHCILDKGHNDGYRTNNCPESIMNSFIFSKNEIRYCYSPEKNFYLDELTN